MPRFDGTGPLGMGLATGRGFGPCGLGLGWRRRFFNWGWPDSKEEQKKALQDYKKALQEELEDVEKKVKEL